MNVTRVLASASRVAAGLAGILVLASVAGAAGPSTPATVTYTVTFDATWSQETHPIDFPPNPHFSGLIGGTHDDQVVFWETGALASPGIKAMAELGQKATLQAEVEAAIADGHAGEVISGGGISPSPGSVSTSFTASTDFPLATVVCMIAPSPDWFVGVSGLNLFQGGAWVPQLVVQMQPYDAGTDSGPTYTSPNQPTVPPIPIYLTMEGPFVEGIPLGTFTFTLDTVADVPPGGSFTVRNYPNPFNPSTTIAYEVPGRGRLSVAVHDLRGGLISLLSDRIVEAGAGSVVWNGRDGSGRQVPAGTYLLRVEALGRTEVRKISLVK